MPRTLILSTQAGEYQRLVEAAGLPDCSTAAPAPQTLSHGGDCEIVFGETARSARYFGDFQPALGPDHLGGSRAPA
jgi:hypothetical protein